MEYLAWLLVIIIALILGFFIGQKGKRRSAIKHAMRLRQDYFRGLNYLINEQPDKAVDIFIKMLEADTETIEIHMALANLFRRKGEVDRAIRIHQNLIARPQLSRTDRVQALNELGIDYMRAGVFDRAERLFLELVAMNEQVRTSLRNLLNIYQQEKDWEQSIIIAQKLQNASGEDLSVPIAHYHCEIAERLREQNNLVQAQRYLKRALAVDAKCARASIIRAQIAEKTFDYPQAIIDYRKVAQQNPDFISEVIEPLVRCYMKTSNISALLETLQEYSLNYPLISIITKIADLYQQIKNNQVAITFMVNQLEIHPSLEGINHLIKLYLADESNQHEPRLILLSNLITRLLTTHPQYRCKECGLNSHTLYWLCPSCKHWSTNLPIHYDRLEHH